MAPGVPVVGHLHGTELLMLEAIERGEAAMGARRGVGAADAPLGGGLRAPARALRHPGRPRRAAPRHRRRAAACRSPTASTRELFRPQELDRGAHWGRHLEALAGYEGTVLLYVGRFTAVKRVPLLIEAYAAAQERFAERAPLVLVGGFPDEWEGEHPDDAIARTGARDVHLAGWHEHHALGAFINASDVIVLPSVAEQFGQVLVEGMACARPVIAVDSHGPAEIVTAGETGWLVEGDDRDGLAAALVEAVNAPGERRRRGLRAREVALERYAWPALAERVAAVYDAARGAA